ncbi:coagulation factor V isoform X1 [Takifugu flavidus]|uniref:coagulation factor V isoform X1 n=1 Tax=Takifugu flavidus TaxID=433684 RepID=UPI0025447D2A|nr:coagulation factor V isoform X1 [Takifugu flavidus]
MSLGSRAGVRHLLSFLVFLTAYHVKGDQVISKERRYYIAAVEIDWDYSGNTTHRFSPTYKKVVFQEYDKDFKQAKSRPPWLGLLGPTLRAEEGEIIVVTFRNLATKPYSIHPHGVAYGKQSEGANYFDNTSQKEKEDDVVWPNSEHVYYWEITSDVSPQQNDPTCLTYTYISHKDVVEDYNSGLIGALLVCKSGSLDESGRQIGIYHEYVFLFGVFNENESKFKQNDPASVDHIKYTINGFTEGSLPDVSICTYAPVSLHLVGMSSDPEVFSVHINGQVLQQNGHKMSSVGLISGSSTTVSMVAVHTGRWLLSSQIMKHIQGKMYGFVNMEICDGFKAPQRTLTREQRKNSREWTYYIAAEEIVWNYAPNEPAHIDQDFKLQYLRQSSTRIGGKYKKAVYTLYTNESFTEQVHKKQRKDELGILGPVIRAQIRDVIKIVFKNKATRPYSIYPHGLTIEKSEEGVNYPPGSNHSHSVQPGETHTYTWKVVEEDEPLDGDARCLTRLYHSAVDTPRDIASGLIGPLLICKSESLNVRNVQLKADKEQHAMFAVFDENMSWYLDDNIRYRCEHSKVNKADPDFYKSNVMHSINGYVFESSPVLGFCNGEVATWHVSSVGAQDYIQTATFYGHTFELNERPEDFLSLYPMTGETISMNMDNIGVWLLASLNSHGTTKGMRLKFQDVECYRDYQYEYDDSTNMEFNVWNPLSLDTIQENEKPILVENKDGEFDSYTEDLANELGLRSLKQQSNGSDVEQLDLSFLDYEVVDVSNETQINFTKTKNDNFAAEINGLNDTSISNRLDVQNLTGADLLNQQINWNSTVMQNSSTLAFLNHSVNEIQKLWNHSPQTKNTFSVIDTDLEAAATVNNTSALSVDTNYSKEITNLAGTLQGKNLTASDSNVTSVSRINMPATRIPSSLSVSKAHVGKNTSSDGTNSSTLEAHGPYLNSSGKVNPFISKSGNVAAVLLKNGSVTVKLPMSKEELDNTSLKNPSNKTSASSSIPSVSTNDIMTSSSEELSSSESSKEVFIYVKDKKAGLIKTTSVKTSGHNWTYDGTHKIVSAEIPDDMKKYFEMSPQTNKKKTRKVNRPHRPQKGHGMKTKRRKEYKPQPRSGLPLSPRGFNPLMSPRGARPQGLQPVNNDETLINMPVVIGVPRPDFSDYELYLPGDEPDHLDVDQRNVKANEYEYVNYKDPYRSNEDAKNLHLDQTRKYLENRDKDVRTYFIAAEEVQWDYAGYGQRRRERPGQNIRHTKFIKVVFRLYLDSSFRTPEVRGEVDEHLGILGPVIKAEVGQTIMVVFKNNASRPFSLHPNGVSYSKQTEGLSYEDGSNYWYKYDNEVQPGATFAYIWNVNPMVGPTSDESNCRTWAYYSGVNPERDIHSGLIGPLLVCRKGTLNQELTNTREFMLLFMTFDESQSWYFDRNREIMPRRSWRKVMDPDIMENLKFHSINGIIYNLKGLRMYTNQLASWHLINMGSPKDFNSVHFHGQTFLHKKTTSYRQAVYPLLPGSFATLEMYPSKPGLWQLETEVGFNQEKGMQTLFLVLADDCYHPLGLESGSVKDDQITATNTRGRQAPTGYWEPHLARLHNQGKYNAWSTDQNYSSIQVDFQRPVVISQVATQGARQFFQAQYVSSYYISYSNDRRSWSFYKGDSRDDIKVFTGNDNPYDVKKNTFFPPLIGRFIRFHPFKWYNKATLRMDFYGCELDGCSVPLGMESGLIEDHQITASSTVSKWYSGTWRPFLGRLNKEGTINAWQAKYNDMDQWLQVELTQVKKITGIVTQGAKFLGAEMFVTSFSLQYSHDGKYWHPYTDDDGIPAKIFMGNTNNNDHVKNYMYPPIFSRFIRVIPKSWIGSITMRMELLGCDCE